METCFNHTDAAKAGTCKYCGKDFCSECLFLQGELDSLMCNNCYKVFKTKYTSSIKRRYIYAFTGIAITISLILLFIIYDYLLHMIVAVAVFCSSVYFFIRIRQMKKALKVKPYTIEEELSQDDSSKS